MAANVVLVEARPRSAGDGAAVVVRLAGGGGVYPYFYGEQHYRAGIAGLPRTIASLDFDGEQLGGGGVPQAMELGWSPATRAALAEVAALYWTDAPITVRIGPEGEALPPIAAAGLVLDGAVEGGSLRIALSDAAAELKKPLLTDRFLGTGGIEGPVELEKIIKSRSWGRCFNVPGQLIDRATNIWCFGDPRRAWRSFVQVRDRGVAATAVLLLAWQGTPEATFAALKGAAAPQGGCVVCPSIACVKWWAEPAGDLKADIEGETAGGYVETVPEIVARLVAVRSTIPIAAGALPEAAAWRPAPSGWRIDNDTTTAADAISELLGDVSLSWLLIGGELRFRRWEWTASTRVARSHRVTRRSTVKPVGTRKLGYRRNWSPMARGDLAAIVLAQDVAYEDGTTVAEAIAAAGKTAEWDLVADPNGNKPENKATNSALPGSPIGPDRTVADVLSTIDVNVDAILAQALRQDDLLQVFNARTLVEGQPVGTQFLAFRDQVSDPVTGFASAVDFAGVFVKSKDGTGYSMKLDAVKAGNATFSDVLAGYNTNIGGLRTDIGDLGNVTGTLSQNLSQVGALAGNTSAKVTNLNQAFASPSGLGFAKALTTVDVNGRIAGYSATSDGKEGVFHIVANRFMVSDPDDPQGAVAPLSVSGGIVRAPKMEVGIVTYDALVDKFAGSRQLLDPSAGFQILPGGFIIQWGRYRQSIGSEVSFSVLFPMRFPTAVMAVIATPYIAVSSDTRDLWLQNLGQPSVQGATFFTQAANTNDRVIDGFDWIAFGK